MKIKLKKDIIVDLDHSISILHKLNKFRQL